MKITPWLQYYRVRDILVVTYNSSVYERNLLHLAYLPSASSIRTSTPSSAEEHVEHVHGGGEAAAVVSMTLFDPLLAKLVVHLPLFRIGEHLVGLRDLFKLVPGIRVLVGVKLQRLLSVSLLQLVRGGGRRDAEHVIIFRLADGHITQVREVLALT